MRQRRYGRTALPLLPERASSYRSFSRGSRYAAMPDCQRRRRAEYHRQKIAADPEYRQVCQDSPRKWRARPSRLLEAIPRRSTRRSSNRTASSRRSATGNSDLRDLANNTSALDLKHSAAEFGWSAPGARDLANNNSASAQVWMIEALPPPPGAAILQTTSFWLPPACCIKRLSDADDRADQ